jgi:biopolymer transport protein ExbB
MFEFTHQLATQLTYVLWIMSVMSWGILFYKLLEHRRVFRDIQLLNVTLTSLETTLSITSDNTSNSSEDSSDKTDWQNALAVLPLTSRLVDLITPFKMTQSEAFVELKLREQLTHLHQWLERGISTLGSIATSAPFIGLLGTVLSIHDALITIPTLQAGSGIDPLIAPVGESLLMTAYGLLVAIPASLFNNYLVSKAQKQKQLINNLAEYLMLKRFDQS